MDLFRRLLCWFFPIVFFGSASGQKVLVPVFNSFQGQFIHYPITVPGADISTTRILFDRKGFIWEGTGNALYRFDGNNYLTYGFRNLDSTSLAGQVVTSIYEDHQGIMWIGTYGALNRLDPRTGLIKQFMPDSADYMNNDNRIKLIHEDKQGMLWVLTCGKIFSFDRETCRFTRYFPDCPFISSSWVNDRGKFLEDSGGNLWLAGKDGLSVKMRGNTDFISYSKSDKVSCVAEDRSGTVWYGTSRKGLHRIVNPGSGSAERIDFINNEKLISKLDTILCILPDDNGTLWLFGNGIFANFSSRTNEIKSWMIRPMNASFNNMKGHQINLEDAFLDKQGCLWMLQREGIVFRFRPESEELLVYNVPNWIVLDWKADNYGSLWFGCANGDTWRLMLNSLPYQVIRVKNMFDVASWDNPRIAEDISGRIWLTLSTGIYRADAPDPGKNFTLQQISLPVADTIAGCIMKDHNGNLWMGLKNSRILMFNTLRGTSRVFLLPDRSSNEIYRIVEDSADNLWFLSFNQIFVLPSGSESIRQFTFEGRQPWSILNEGIYDMLPDSRGNLWLASYNNGVYAYNIESKSIIRYTSERESDLLSGDFCLRIREDSKGRIWVLFNNNGLYIFNPATQKLKPVRLLPDSPPGLNYFELFIDRSNRLFINHNYGLTVYDPDRKTLRQVSFSQQIGNYCTCQLLSGNLLNLSGSELRLFSDTIPSNHIIPEVYLTGLKIDGNDFSRELPGTGDLTSLEEIRLRHNQNDLQIDFAALSYLYPSANRYKYMLKGIDNDTVYMNNYHSVEYKKLQPGKYNFWFTGSNNDGVWNREGKSLEFRISPPVTRTAAAYITYLFVTILVIAVFIRRHFNKLLADRNRLEKEVQLRTLELEKKNEKIEEMDRLKTRFFTEISHEIRTPLTLILGPVENLITENHRFDDSGRMHLFELIKRNSIRLLSLVNKLLDISKIDAGKMKLNLVESDVLKSVRTLAYEFLSLAESRNIRFKIEIPDEPFITFYDREKTERILSNLLSNAFKFTPANGCVTCIARINSEEGAHPPVLKIVVKDTGIGISSENIGQIFDRFYRVEGHIETDFPGTGIGLSITREFVNLLHGTIEVTSEKDAGSTFTVKLPLGTVHLGPEEYVLSEPYRETANDSNPDDCRHEQTGEKATETVTSGKKPYLLLIEDNIDLRDFLRENFFGDYRVIEASNGKEGLEIALSKIPDLVITDIIMPDLDGIEVCKTMKNDERTSHIPIILLTAKSAVDDRIEGFSAGADVYIRKPPDINELKTVIKNLLIQREKLRQKYTVMSLNGHTADHVNTIDDKFMANINQVIEENLRFYDFDVSALQDEMGMSRMQLYRKLKALTGLAPSVLIYNRRMLRAARLLMDKSGNLTEIALSVGFSNPSYFSKCFKDFYGVTPKSFEADQRIQSKVDRRMEG